MTDDRRAGPADPADWPEMAAAILACWFEELGPDRWWVRSDETDETIAARFTEAIGLWRSLPPDAFLADARAALAAVILFDQFPRNIHRGGADAFATDPLALAIARAAVERGLDTELAPGERHFLYMPFMHSENREDQHRSLLLFERLGIDEALKFAREHAAVIERFGRFPHRNAVLGRADRPGEAGAAREAAAW